MNAACYGGTDRGTEQLRHMMAQEYFVLAEWDAEAGVWYTADTDVPGLVTEAASLDALAAKLMVMIPEMLELNGVIEPDHVSVPFELLTKFHGAPGHC